VDSTAPIPTAPDSAVPPSAPDAAAPDTSQPTPVDPACGAPPAGGFHPYETAANGSVAGPDVTATVCNAAASVLTNRNGTFLEIASYSNVTAVTFQNPTDANTPLIDILVPAGATPGRYSSSDAVNCGNVQFSYGLPVPPGTDCDGGAPPQCPPGCISACSGFGCEPCAPNPPFYGYGASGQTGGICAEVYTQPGTLMGSWTIELTSVVAFQGDAGGLQGSSYATVHGTLEAQMLGGGGDAGSEPATLSLTF